ncbi:nucleolar protein [Seiridium cupressi]
MFELPNSKRVRREELYDEVASDHEASLDEAAENDLRGKLSAQLSGLLDFDIAPNVAAVQQAQPTEPEEAEAVPAGEPEGELSFEFRLFRDEAPTHKVVIEQNDDDPEARGEGAFVVPKRPISYYIAGEPDSAIVEKFRFAAVTPDYIFADAKQRRWGLEKPWHVTHITITGGPSGKGSLKSSTEDTQMADDKRKRPGKKRRIILRTREKAKKEKAEAAKKQLETKEEHLKAKKRRLNREKKLKRRAKEKEKKAADGGNTDQAGDEKMEDISDDSSEA